MKRFLNLLIMVLGIIMSTYAQNRSINFIEGKTFAEIKELAKKENKMIFMDFYTTWCGPCKMMDKKVYTNDSVADFYNSHFISIKIDADKGEGVELKKEYQVQVYPTFLFASFEGKMLHRGCGFRVPKDFIQLGADASNPEKQISKLTDAYTMGEQNPELILQLVDSMRAVGMPVGKFVSEYLSHQKDSDLLLKTNWELINLYVKDLNSREIQFLIKNHKEFSLMYGDSAISKKITKVFFTKAYFVGRSRDKDKAKQLSDLRELIRTYHFSWEEDIFSTVDLNFHFGAGNWQEFSKVCVSGIIERYYWHQASSLNTIASAFYDHINDPIFLRKALSWSVRSIELEDNSENNVVCALLLLKLGEKEKAIEKESHALQLGIKDGLIEAKDYDKLLSEFKKKKK